MELTLCDSLISSLRRDPNGKLFLIQTTAPVSPGSSGGGLFDEEGRLIGLTTLQLKEARNINFAVPINWMRELAARSEAFVKSSKEAIARDDTGVARARACAVSLGLCRHRRSRLNSIASSRRCANRMRSSWRARCRARSR